MTATLLLAPGFQTSVIVVATIWSPSVKNWSLYKNGKKFWE